VKIIDLDLERRRISLSIKQAAEGGTVAAEYQDIYGEHAYDEHGNYIGPAFEQHAEGEAGAEAAAGAEAPAAEAPGAEAPADEARADEARADEAPADEAPADEAPAAPAPVEEAAPAPEAAPSEEPLSPDVGPTV
ncbi:MAG: 30S ribosomal protein S1, partial [Acidimicrobiia bacterium]